MASPCGCHVGPCLGRTGPACSDPQRQDWPQSWPQDCVKDWPQDRSLRRRWRQAQSQASLKRAQPRQHLLRVGHALTECTDAATLLATLMLQPFEGLSAGH